MDSRIASENTNSDSDSTTQQGKYHGTVKWFNNAKGYGFIIADDDNNDLFSHYSSINIEGYKTLKAGQLVNFDTKQVDGGIHAINISIASDSPIK
mgnify:CR=1 FL=1